MKAEMIDCRSVMERLWAFLDGELEPPNEAEMREHLRMCKRCYPKYDFQRAYFRMMEKLAAEPTPPLVRRRVYEDLLTD